VSSPPGNGLKRTKPASCGASVSCQRPREHCATGWSALVEGAIERPNKRMQLTKLRAAPVRQAEVPPCAPAGEMDGGTASQLIRGVRRT
jgi:hypothetical protein